MALLKAQDPVNQFAWLVTDQKDNNTVKTATPSAPSDLHQDLMALAGSQQRLRYSLI